MYGIKPDLPVDAFVGHQFTQVAIGRFQLQLHCDVGSISIESRWRLLDANGAVLDEAQDHASRAAYRIHRIVDLPVERVSLDPPRSFTLAFAGGLTLTVFDDSAHREAFSMDLDGRPSIVV